MTSKPSSEPSNETGSDRIFLWFGLDVSKKSFTVACHNGISGKTVVKSGDGFTSDPTGVRQFLKWRGTILKEVRGKTAIPDALVMEATGHYSTNLAKQLLKSNGDLRISICNAYSISHYLRSHKTDKSDRQDAEFIARYGQDAQPNAWTPRESEVELLKELLKQRHVYAEMRAALANRVDSLECSEVVTENRTMIGLLDKRLKKLDEQIRKAVQATKEMKEEITLMTTVPGVALLSAATIYAELGSLKQYTRNQLSALSGVCPINRQSGTSVHSSRLSRRGSAELRRILYLDSFQGILRIPALAAMQSRLLARPESNKMSARCACMRKQLMILRGVVVSGKPFDKNFNSAKQAGNAESSKNTEKCEKTA